VAACSRAARPGAPQFTYEELRVAAEGRIGWGAASPRTRTGKQSIKDATRPASTRSRHGTSDRRRGIRLMKERGTFLGRDIVQRRLYPGGMPTTCTSRASTSTRSRPSGRRSGKTGRAVKAGCASPSGPTPASTRTATTPDNFPGWCGSAFAGASHPRGDRVAAELLDRQQDVGPCRRPLRRPDRI